MRKQYYNIILFIILFTVSCKRDTNSPLSVFTKASYPLAVGDWWQYQVTYCFGGGGAVDTVMLNTVSMTNVGPYIQYKCNIIFNGAVYDSGYFLQSDTSLSFIGAASYYSLFPNFHLKFPLSTGQYWQGAFPGDSTLVVGVADSCQGSYGNTYGACYSTVESYNLPHNFKVARMLLTPKVGLVTQSFDFKSDTAAGGFGVDVCQSIYLINCHVQ